MTTYQPTGHGICAHCGHDVGQHDDGHHYSYKFGTVDVCECGLPFRDPIHDVGRVLRCPEVDDAHTRKGYVGQIQRNLAIQGGPVTTEKIAPCPWGKTCEVQVFETYSVWNAARVFWVECMEEGHWVSGPKRKTRAGAIKAWNERRPK